ncbi:MAG: hypothetical protein U5L76_04795 [Patescibacteria group bacterium]|nr:hypothetical protein [Patescibacteria group bacterium]
MNINRAEEVYHQLRCLAENRPDIPMVECEQILRKRGYSDKEILAGCLILFNNFGQRIEKLLKEKINKILIT